MSIPDESNPVARDLFARGIYASIALSTLDEHLARSRKSLSAFAKDFAELSRAPWSDQNVKDLLAAAAKAFRMHASYAKECRTTLKFATTAISGANKSKS